MSKQNGTITEKKSNNDVDRAADFVSRSIDSCLDTWQLQGAYLLMEYFKKTYYEKRGGKMAFDRLQTQIVNKLPLIVVLS